MPHQPSDLGMAEASVGMGSLWGIGGGENPAELSCWGAAWWERPWALYFCVDNVLTLAGEECLALNRIWGQGQLEFMITEPPAPPLRSPLPSPLSPRPGVGSLALL